MKQLTKLTFQLSQKTREYCGVTDLVLKEVLDANVKQFGFSNAPIL